jgi:hypothetical protein
LKDLDARGDVFYKEAITTDKTWLAVEIKTIAAGDTEREEELLLALNSFYEKWPTSSKNMEISWTRPTITFTTYDQEATIDLEDKTLTWLVTTKAFSSYQEAFKAASLTNYIKKLCKDKESTTATPFHVSVPGGDIEFADPSTFAFDTEILSAGIGWSLKEISPTLEDNKQAYCDYLNSLKFRVDKSTTTTTP